MIPLQRVVLIWSEISYYWGTGVHTYGQYLPLISNSSHYSLYFTPLSKNWNNGVVLPHHMPEFWYVMKKGSKSIIRFSGGSIWKQWERNLWRCRAAFIFLSNIFMSQACYWTTFKNEPVNMGWELSTRACRTSASRQGLARRRQACCPPAVVRLAPKC